MNVEVRGESVVISGYVNAVERFSKPITSKLRDKMQTFIERIKAGAFKTALKRNENVEKKCNSLPFHLTSFHNNMIYSHEII